MYSQDLALLEDLELEDLELLEDLETFESDFQSLPAPLLPASTPALIKVTDTRAMPSRWVCSIAVRYAHADLLKPVAGTRIGGAWFAGSGVLISRCHVLTAGHVIRATKAGKIYKPEEIIVVPGQVPAASLTASAPFGVWKASPSDTHVDKSLFDAKQLTARLFDFGLIKLNRKNFKQLGDTTLPGTKEKFGWFSSLPGDSVRQFNHLFGVTIARRKVNVAGFPLIGGKNQQMYRGFNSIASIEPPLGPKGAKVPLMSYSIATKPGISGGPVWLKDLNSPSRQLIAVHDGTSGGVGWGLPLRPSIIRFLTANGAVSAGLKVS
jgi:V8-like Glu-specific endopeptidase